MMSHWIYIERQHSDGLAVGPYKSQARAILAMENALIIDDFCQEDCLECYVSNKAPKNTEWSIVTIDPDDPDQTGIGMPKNDDRLIRFTNYQIEEKKA